MIMLRLFFFTAVIILFFSCTVKDKKPAEVPPLIDAYTPFFNQIKEGKTLLKEGDLIVRSGNDMTSQLIKNFNKKDKNYSHAGIVFLQDGEPKIYHILAGVENPDAKMVTDSLEKFCYPRQNTGFAIYRYNVESAEISTMKTVVTNWYKQGVGFDSAFNLQSDDRMYCSEMIKKALARATKNRIIIATTKPSRAEALLGATRLPLPVEYISKLDLIPIDHLYVNPHCRLIARFDFNPQK
jgi:hypothetical protein